MDYQINADCYLFFIVFMDCINNFCKLPIKVKICLGMFLYPLCAVILDLKKKNLMMKISKGSLKIIKFRDFQMICIMLYVMNLGFKYLLWRIQKAHISGLFIFNLHLCFFTRMKYMGDQVCPSQDWGQPLTTTSATIVSKKSFTFEIQAFENDHLIYICVLSRQKREILSYPSINNFRVLKSTKRLFFVPVNLCIFFKCCNVTFQKYQTDNPILPYMTEDLKQAFL